MDKTESREALEIKLLGLQVKRLQQELDGSKDLEKSLLDWVKGLVPLVTAFVAVSGLVWGVFQYRFAQEDAKKQRTYERQLKVLDEKKAIYLDLIESTASIAACPNSDKVKEIAPKFRGLYWGRAHSIELDDGVLEAKLNFEKNLTNYLRAEVHEKPSSIFGEHALAMSKACGKKLLLIEKEIASLEVSP